MSAALWRGTRRRALAEREVHQHVRSGCNGAGRPCPQRVRQHKGQGKHVQKKAREAGSVYALDFEPHLQTAVCDWEVKQCEYVARG